MLSTLQDQHSMSGSLSKTLDDGEGWEVWLAAVHGVTESDTNEQLNNKKNEIFYEHSNGCVFFGFSISEPLLAIERNWIRLSRNGY